MYKYKDNLKDKNMRKRNLYLCLDRDCEIEDERHL